MKTKSTLSTVKLAVIGFLVIVTGCSSNSTHYHKLNSEGYGYTAKQIEEAVFQIKYKGNYSTKSQRVRDFALLRSAEQTIQNKYRYFVIVEESEKEEEKVVSKKMTTLSKANSSTPINIHSRFPNTKALEDVSSPIESNTTTFHYTRSEVTLTISMHHKKPENMESFQALELLEKIKSQYDIETGS